jgi:hypothetical protein
MRRRKLLIRAGSKSREGEKSRNDENREVETR